MIRGALLDIDGTLLDSNNAHALAWAEACEQSGRKVAVESVLPLIGMGGDKLLPALIGLAADSDEGREISRHHKSLFMHRYLPTLRPFDGARELVLKLHARGLAVVIATSANGAELLGLLRQAEIDDLIEHAATSSDAGSSKPDPDIVRAAVAKSGHRASEVCMIGDTPYDVEAARRAGVRAIAVRTGGWSDDKLTDAVAIYDDVHALWRDFDTSPLSSSPTPSDHDPSTRSDGERSRSRTQS